MKHSEVYDTFVEYYFIYFSQLFQLIQYRFISFSKQVHRFFDTIAIHAVSWTKIIFLVIHNWLIL